MASTDLYAGLTRAVRRPARPRPPLADVVARRGPEGYAVFSQCGRFRYELVRWLGTGGRLGPTVRFVLLNPSTADEHVLDPTLRRCADFARRWGYGEMVVHNLFAFRSTSPQAMAEAAREGQDVVGPGNDLWISQCSAELTVVGWGAHRIARDRAAAVLGMLGTVSCLGCTSDGSPRHPLYLPRHALPTPYRQPVPAGTGAAVQGGTQR